MPPPFLRTAGWKQQLSGTTSGKKLKVSYKDNRKAQKICGFFLKKTGAKDPDKKKVHQDQKVGHYVSDQTLLLTAKMVNSCKNNDDQEVKKDIVIPIKMNMHLYKTN